MSWNPTDSPESKPRFRAGSSRVRRATIAAAAIVAGGAAYAANQQKKSAANAAKQAGKPSNIDQTTTQTGWGPAQDQLQYALDQTRSMYDAGPVLRGSGGVKPVYETRPDGRVVQANKPPKGGKGGGGAGGGKDKGGPKAPTAKQQQQAIADKITNTAMAGSPNLPAADAYVGRVLEEGSIGGNEVNQDLYQRLAGSDLGRGEDLLNGFLGGRYGSGGGQEGGGGGASQRQYTADGTPVATGGSFGGGYATRAPGGAQAYAQAGLIPDSTTSPGLFNDWAKGVLGGKYLDPNDPALKDFLDMQQRRGQEGLDAQLQDVGDEFEGVGMYGGSGLALERSLARSRGLQGIADERTAALMGYREQGMNLMGQTAGQVNTRDISAGQIASSDRQASEATGAASAAASAASANQLAIANRGMDLEAIQSFLQNNQFGVGQLADLGRGVSADRMGALDAMTGLEGVRYGGLNNAFGVQGNLRQQQGAEDAAAAARRARQDELAYQDRLAPGRHLDEYLNRLGFFNSAGGTSHTQGTNTNPGAAAPYIANQGPGALSAGLAAGAGTYFQGYAARQQQPPPPQQYPTPAGRVI